MQLLAFGDCGGLEPLTAALQQAEVEAVLYEDVHDPFGVGLLAMSEDPTFFVDRLRPLLQGPPFRQLTRKPAYTMFGRTYSMGHEPDLDETLLARPRRHALNPDWPWAIWYPLRRRGAFAQLPPERQSDILTEHGRIGFAFGRADHAHDIRLACFGLDRNDNDFVIGLMGKDLHPLSAVVQAMRNTIQTSQYIKRLGPFFLGRVAWRGGH